MRSLWTCAALSLALMACEADEANPSKTDTHDGADTLAPTDAEPDTTDSDTAPEPDTTDSDTAPEPDTTDADTSESPVFRGVALEPATVIYDAPPAVLAILDVTGFQPARDLARLTLTTSAGATLTATLTTEACPAERTCVTFTPPPAEGPGRLTLSFALAGQTVETTLGLRAPADTLEGPLPPPIPLPALGQPIGSWTADLDGDGADELVVLHRAPPLPNGLTSNPPTVTVYGVDPALGRFVPGATHTLGPLEGEDEVSVFSRANILDSESRYIDLVIIASGRRARTPSGELELVIALDTISSSGVQQELIRLPVDHTFLTLVPDHGANTATPWVLTVSGEPDPTLYLHRAPVVGTQATAPIAVPLPEGLIDDIATGRRGLDVRILSTTDPTTGFVRRTLDLAIPLAPGENWCGDTPHLRVLQIRGLLGDGLTLSPSTCRKVETLTDEFVDFDPATLGLRIERHAPLRFTQGNDEAHLELEVLGGVVTHGDGALENRYQVSGTWTSPGLAPRTELLFAGRGLVPPRFELVTAPSPSGGPCQHLAITGHDHRLGDFSAHLPGPQCGAQAGLVATAPRPTGASRYYHIMDWDSVASPPTSTCGHYTQQIWANTLKVGCGAPPSPTLDHEGGQLTIAGDLAFASPRPTTEPPFSDDLGTGARTLLDHRAFPASGPDDGYWLVATVSGPLRDQGPNTTGPRLVVGPPETHLLRVSSGSVRLGGVSVEDTLRDDLWLGSPGMFAFHPTRPNPSTSNNTKGYLGFRGQPLAFAPGRQSAILTRVEATPMTPTGDEVRLALVEVARVDLPDSTNPWEVVAVGDTDAVPWLIAMSEDDGALKLARLSRCQGCEPELEVAPIGEAAGPETHGVMHVDVEPIVATSNPGNKRLQFTFRSTRVGTQVLAWAPDDLLDGIDPSDIRSTTLAGCPEGQVAPLGLMSRADGAFALTGLLLDEGGFVVGQAQAELLDSQGRLHDGRVYLCNRGLNHWGDRAERVQQSGAHTFAELSQLQDLDGDGLTDLISAPRFAQPAPRDGWPLLLSGDGRGATLSAEPLPPTASLPLIASRTSLPRCNPPLGSPSGFVALGHHGPCDAQVRLERRRAR